MIAVVPEGIGIRGSSSPPVHAIVTDSVAIQPRALTAAAPADSLQWTLLLRVRHWALA